MVAKSRGGFRNFDDVLMIKGNEKIKQGKRWDLTFISKSKGKDRETGHSIRVEEPTKVRKT